MQKFTCTSCSYVYNPFVGEENILPGTSFENLDESWVCPHCGDDKDVFIETPQNIQEISGSTYTDEEVCHIPFYKEQGGVLMVQVGTTDNPHEIEENHFIEYVGVFDGDGEILEIQIQPEDTTLVFENPGIDDYEVRLSCNIHGIWRGIRIKDTLQ